MAYHAEAATESLCKIRATTLLTDREKELVRFAVTVTKGCPVCMGVRMEKARAAGIEDNVLNALVGIVCRSACAGH